MGLKDKALITLIGILSVSFILVAVGVFAHSNTPGQGHMNNASRPNDSYSLTFVGSTPIPESWYTAFAPLINNSTMGQNTSTLNASASTHDWPWPQPREDVIVYFKEMPSSLQGFASSYGVKLIFAKPDIEMAAFETMPELQPGEESMAARNFIAGVSNDSRVERAEFDTCMFTDTTKNYTGRPTIVNLEDLNKTGTEYVPNQVTVGFWRIPPYTDEFGAKYGGTPVNSSIMYIGNVSYFVAFNTSNMTGFINNVSGDPYVRSADVNAYLHID